MSPALPIFASSWSHLGSTLEASVERKGKPPYRVTYGKISLARNPKPVEITDTRTKPQTRSRSQLIERLRTGECEMCGKKGKAEVHHVRKLKDMHKPGRKMKTLWEQRMIVIRRKTLICCPKCHKAIDTGKHLSEWDLWKNTLESRVP